MMHSLDLVLYYYSQCGFLHIYYRDPKGPRGITGSTASNPVFVDGLVRFGG